MSAVNGAAGPLCNAGRCSAILRGLAEARVMERVVEQQGAVLADVLRAALTDLGLDPSDTSVQAAVARAIRRVTGAGSTGG